MPISRMRVEPSVSVEGEVGDVVVAAVRTGPLPAVRRTWSSERYTSRTSRRARCDGTDTHSSAGRWTRRSARGRSGWRRGRDSPVSTARRRPAACPARLGYRCRSARSASASLVQFRSSLRNALFQRGIGRSHRHLSGADRGAHLIEGGGQLGKFADAAAFGGMSEVAPADRLGVRLEPA